MSTIDGFHCCSFSRGCSVVLHVHEFDVYLCNCFLRYFPQDNVLVLAASRRYREKYVTTLMYKPVQLH